MKLSVVIPVYNEMETLAQIIDTVQSVQTGLSMEIIVVDDGSTDGTRAVLESQKQKHSNVVTAYHGKNSGKGSALRTGFKMVSGDIVLVQDADLEYDPQEYMKLLKPILDGHADVVFGSRFQGGGPHRVVFFWHYLGNRVLTTLSNMMTNLNLTDMEVGYKVFRRKVLDTIMICENRFGFEPEITAKVAKGRWRIYEVPVSYYGRDYSEGKKITWKDGVRALWCIIKYRLRD